MLKDVYLCVAQYGQQLLRELLGEATVVTWISRFHEEQLTTMHNHYYIS